MIDFLSFLHPGYGYTEIRAFKPGEEPVQRFYWPAEGLIVDAVTLDRQGWDVFRGVLPRQHEGGKSKDVWPTATVLWCDIDAKDFEDGRALDAVLRFPVPPSVIVDSGHGFHTYWRLREPVDTSDAVDTNQAIAHWMGGDACFDAPRILRLPGLHNHKDPENPIPVRLLKLDTLRTYDLSDFTEMVESFRAQEVRKPRVREDGRREDAPPWLTDLINDEPPPGARSEAEFKAGVWMARLGYSDDEIDTVLSNSPVGAKYQERNERWREAEIRRIRSKA